MKFGLFFSFFIVIGLAKQSKAGKYKDGYEDGQDKVNKMWKKDYNSDCYDVFDFSITIKEDLILGDYNLRKDDNWAREAYKRGARDGATAEMVAIQMECLDPQYCDELGMTAAELIVSDLCGGKSSATKRKHDPILMCRKASTATCEGKIYREIKKTIKHTKRCDGLKDDIKNLSTKLLLDLQDECKEQVDELIQWDEFNDS